MVPHWAAKRLRGEPDSGPDWRTMLTTSPSLAMLGAMRSRLASPATVRGLRRLAPSSGLQRETTFVAKSLARRTRSLT